MKIGCVCLILMPIVALPLTIDQQIADASDSNILTLFQVSSNGDIMVKTELDILMNADKYKKLHEPERKSRGKRKAATVTKYYDRWPDNTVYYRLLGKMEASRGIIMAAMDQWDIYTCLKFKENPSSPHRIEIQYGDGCSSHVGRFVYPQELYLDKSCLYVGAILHELGHAIGFHHEHMRPDRDTYVYINFKILNPIYHSAFEKYTQGINTYGIPYDYTSIMHYGGLRGIITALDPAYQGKIGKSTGLSFKDIKLANLMYNCSSPHCPDKACPFNGFVFFKPFKGQPKCECWCNSGNGDDPLVLCSSIDKEFPEPNLPGVTTLPKTNVSGCIDMRDNCAYLKKKGTCRTEMIKMYSLCPKTCDFCGKGRNLCMDHDDGCGMMAESGACQQGGWSKTMSQLCPKSCGLCVTISAPCEIEHSLMDPSNPIDRGVSKRIRWITVVSLVFVASSFCMRIDRYI